MPNWKSNLLIILSPRQFQYNSLFQSIHAIRELHRNLGQKETRDTPVGGKLLPASQGFPTHSSAKPVKRFQTVLCMLLKQVNIIGSQIISRSGG